MFQKARVRLTLWYLMIIMLISIVFSVFIYRLISAELMRFAYIQHARIERQLQQGGFIDPVQRDFLLSQELNETDFLKEAQRRLFMELLATNVVILVAAGGIGYLLAGKTLRPIQKMVDEQSLFVTDASHELRTPLTALKSSIEVGLRDSKITLNEAKTLLRSNLEEVNELQMLSDSLLELTHYEKQDSSRLFTEIDVKIMLEEARKKVEPLLTKKHMELRLTAGSQHVLGEMTSLVRLFVILLDNAIKYSPEKSQISVATYVIDGFLGISVEDHGQGIHEADLPHIFDRFYRSDKSRSKDQVDGYGLGLSIAQKIVQQHRGKIKVEKTGKDGTTFLVELPLYREKDRTRL